VTTYTKNLKEVAIHRYVCCKRGARRLLWIYSL